MKCTQSYFKLLLFALKQFEKIKLEFYLINFSDCIIWRVKKNIYKRYLECFSVFGFQHRWKQHLIILRGSQVIAAAIILFSLNFIRFSTCEMRRLNRALHVNPFFFLYKVKLYSLVFGYNFLCEIPLCHSLGRLSMLLLWKSLSSPRARPVVSQFFQCMG